MEVKGPVSRKEPTSGPLEIWVHFDLDPRSAGSFSIPSTTHIDGFRKALIREFPNTLAGCTEARDLVVRASPNPTAEPLGEAGADQELWQAPMFDATTGKPVHVYVEAPKTEFGTLLAKAEKAERVTVTDTNRPFVNRKKEIRELCHYLVKNIERCYLSKDQAVTKRKTLVLSVQSFGAGKTTLGTNFLLQLKKNPDDHIAECKKNLKQKDEVRDAAFTHLLNLQHVLVDLRKVSVLDDAHWELINAMVAVEMAAGNYKKGQHPQLRKELQSKPLTCCRIVRAFEDEFKHDYFVQFDDIERLLHATGLKGTAALLSDFSEIQDNCPTPKSLVFVTSRSPLFYLMGTKFIQAEGLANWTPPSSAHSVVLDSLNADHILEMMPDRTSASREIAEVVSDRTGGVPRFVVGALDMLARNPPSEWLSLMKGRALFEHLQEEFYVELYAWQNLLTESTKVQEIAVELIRLASLSMPFSLTQRLDPRWAEPIKAKLPNPETISLTVTPILLCSIFPLYIARVPLEEKQEVNEENALWRFVIPPVCLEAISPHHERLPIMQPIESMGQGEYLEAVVRRCVRLRVSDGFIRTRAKKVGALFPFLAGTLVGEAKMNCRGYATFPKLVKEESSKSDDELKSLMGEAVLNRPLCDVNRNHLSKLLEFMHPNLVSTPMEKSHSADLFYLTEEKHLIEWQMKAGAQVLQPAAAVDELLKGSSSCIGAPLLSLTFIFVCLEGVSKKFFEHTKPTHETNYAFHFQPGARFACGRACANPACKGQSDCAHVKAKTSEFVVPPQMEVLILKQEGLCSLLSDANLQAIRMMRENASSQTVSPFALHTQAVELSEPEKEMLLFSLQRF